MDVFNNAYSSGLSSLAKNNGVHKFKTRQGEDGEKYDKFIQLECFALPVCASVKDHTTRLYGNSDLHSKVKCSS